MKYYKILKNSVTNYLQIISRKMYGKHYKIPPRQDFLSTTAEA